MIESPCSVRILGTQLLTLKPWSPTTAFPKPKHIDIVLDGPQPPVPVDLGTHPPHGIGILSLDELRSLPQPSIPCDSYPLPRLRATLRVFIPRPVADPPTSDFATERSRYAAWALLGTPLSRPNLVGMFELSIVHYLEGIKEKKIHHKYFFAVAKAFGGPHGWVDWLLGTLVGLPALREKALHGRIITQKALDSVPRVGNGPESDVVGLYCLEGAILARFLASGYPGKYGGVSWSKVFARSATEVTKRVRKQRGVGKRIQRHTCPVWRAKEGMALYKEGMDLPEFDNIDWFFSHVQMYSFEELDKIVTKIADFPEFKGKADLARIAWSVVVRCEFVVFTALGHYCSPLIVQEASKRDLLLAPFTANTFNRGSPLARCGSLFNPVTGAAAGKIVGKIANKVKHRATWAKTKLPGWTGGTSYVVSCAVPALWFQS